MSGLRETWALQGGARLLWVDRSGYAGADHLPLADQPLEVRFTKQPRALRATHRPGATALLLHPTSGLDRTDPHAVADWHADQDAAYDLEGEVRDPAGCFLPRRFSLRLPARGQETVCLYRSPMGVRYKSGGGVQGSLRFEGGGPAAWAMIRLEVNVPLSGVLPFLAQADARGEFRLPLDRLPALGKDAPRASYAALLSVRASPEAPADCADPDLFADMRLSGLTDPAFAATAACEITPGTVAALASAGHPFLVVKP